MEETKEVRLEKTPEEVRKETMEILRTLKTDESAFTGRQFVGKVAGIRARKQKWDDGNEDTMVTLFLETDFTEKLVPSTLKYSEHPKSKYALFLKALKGVGVRIDSLADLEGQTFKWEEKNLVYEIEGKSVESTIMLPIGLLKEEVKK